MSRAGSTIGEDAFGEYRAIFLTLRVFGLAPYVVRRTRATSRYSHCRAFYNAIMAASVLACAYYKEKDEANDIDYPNKTFLVDTAYRVVHVLGNIYVATVTISAMFHTDVAIDMWFQMAAINNKLRTINIDFDYKRMRVYVVFKMVLLISAAAIFGAIEMSTNFHMGLHYTANYWFVVLFPMLYSCVVGIVFGSCALSLFQRYWVVNEFLRRFTIEYTTAQLFTRLTKRRTHYSEKILEEVVLDRTHVTHMTQESADVFGGSGSIPFLVMLKNYPECFAHRPHRNLLYDLREVRVLHFQLFRLRKNVNELFGKHFLFIFVCYFFGCTLNLYYAITFHLRSFQEEKYISACCWSLVYIFFVVYLITYCNIAAKEAHHTTELVHKFQSIIGVHDTQLQAELQAFSLQLLQCPTRFTASGFFVLDSTLLFQFVAGVLSNVVFIVQFDKINFSE